MRCAKECNGRMARGKRSCWRERPVTAKFGLRRGFERRGGIGGALSQGEGEDGMGWDGSKKTEGLWTRRQQDMYIPCQPVADGPKRSSASLCAPNLRRRADIFSTPGQASKTTICSGSRGLRQCAEALDGVSGVSTGKRYRRGETPLSAHYSNPSTPPIDATLPVPCPKYQGGLPPGTREPS